MKLFLDTVSEGITVKILDANRLEVASLHVPTPNKKQKDRMVNGVVERTLSTAGIGFAGITQYEVVTGPGSWTGARVGVAVIKAYYMANPRPIVAKPSGKIVTGEELEPLYDKEFTITPPKKNAHRG